MKPFFWALLVLLLAGGTAAADTTYGPYLDCDQYVGVAGGGYATVPTRVYTGKINDPTVKFYDIGDQAVEGIIGERGLAYVTTGLTSTSGQAEDVITTIYGQAYTPIGTGLETTGFTAASPEMTPVSGETIIGLSGTEYTSFWASGPTALSDLGPTLLLGDGGTTGSILGDFDLSDFQGDPTSVVYMFQTYVPDSDIEAPVPEPLTMVALGMGIASLGGYIRRRRLTAI